MNDIKTSVVVDLSGNLARNAKKYENSLGNFSKNGQRHLSRLSRVAGSTGRMLSRAGNRYTALIGGVAGVAVGKQLISLERRFTRLGIQSNKSADDMNRLKNEIYDVANAPNIRVDPSEITSAIEAIVEKTGDLDFARRNIDNIGLAIQATGASGSAIGEIMAEFQKMGIVIDKDVITALDTLNVQGKEGAFTLENLAALGPRVVTAYTSMGRGGVQAIREMGAALQVIRQGTGTSEMAATAFEAMLRTLGDDKKVKMLQKGGIKVFDVEALKRGEEILRPINELMVEIVEKTGGKKTLLSKVFEAEAVRAFNAASSEFQRTGAVASMDKFMQVHADGTTTLDDSSRAAKDAAGSVEMLSTAWKSFADKTFSGPLKDASELLDKLGSERTGKIIKGAAIGVGGLIAGSLAVKSVGVVKDVAGLFGKGKKSGIAGALSSAGATPVYVVNMPGDGLRKGAKKGFRTGSSLKDRVAKKASLFNTKSTLKLGAAGLGTASLAATAAGAVGYGVGTGIYSLIDETSFADTLGSVIAKTLAALGNNEAQAAVAASKLHIEVSDKRVQVKKIQGENLDIQVDAGMAMAAG
ncbi:MAG: phage tail tape measure protein [Cycloclasticus sp.]